jgi:diaminobutyrate-2-oxoglutarate transaminase
MIYGVEMGTSNCKEVTRECFERGLIISPCGPSLNVMKLIPPLTIENDVLQQGMSIFEDAVRAQEGN